MNAPTCRKCGGSMKLGVATGQTFDCSDEGTCSPGGPGFLQQCFKCEKCGWSVTTSNTGHGHVYPRPDGVRMRCGGPAMCPVCAADLARSHRIQEQVAAERVTAEKFTPCTYKCEAYPECACAPAKEPPSSLLEWACWRWREEVQDRPLVNKNRRTLDDTWRQVIRFAGGDPDALIGPAHDALLAAASKDQQL